MKIRHRLYSTDEYPLVEGDPPLAHYHARLATKRNRRRPMPMRAGWVEGGYITLDAPAVRPSGGA